MGRPRLVSDEQILTAMRGTVLSEGPNVPLDRVADQLEVSVPALLKRFGSRQALMLAALRPPERPAWIERVEQGPDDRPLCDQLNDIFTDISEFMESAIPCLSALRESGIPPQAIFSKNNGPLKGLKAVQVWLAAARKKGLVTVPEVETAAFAMLGAIQNRAFFDHMLRVKSTHRERRQYIEELCELFTRALNPDQSPHE